MIGAREYAELFKTGEYGRLYIVSSSHARGRTFTIQILPEGEKAILNGSNNQCLNKDAVLVYGVVSGNPGWTETYGWLHQGKWQEDFQKLVDNRKAEIERKEEEVKREKKIEEIKRQSLTNELLSKY